MCRNRVILSKVIKNINFSFLTDVQSDAVDEAAILSFSAGNENSNENSNIAVIIGKYSVKIHRKIQFIYSVLVGNRKFKKSIT